MNSREFYTKSLLQSHAAVVQEFLANADGEELDRVPYSSEKLAERASRLAYFLTLRWEESMNMCQVNDDEGDSGATEFPRPNSTANLHHPFRRLWDWDSLPTKANDDTSVISNGNAEHRHTKKSK
jgi:hypothetical protein